jgi:hypothetical protein
MTARTGLATNIELVRGMCNCGTADYTVGTVSYWTDTHIQDVLDRNRLDIVFEPLKPAPQMLNGTANFYEYRCQYGNLESGTAVFNLKTSAGSVVTSTDYSVDYNKGIITFTADQCGTAYYVTAYSYDLNGAAADVWGRKASYFTESVNFSTDNMRVDMGAIIENCQKMADYYGSRRQMTSITFERDDMNCGDE